MDGSWVLGCILLAASNYGLTIPKARAFARAEQAKLDKDDPCRNMTGVKTVDMELSTRIAFYRGLFAFEAGKLWFVASVTLAAALNTFLAIEGQRIGGTALHFVYPLVQVASLALSVGVVAPAVYIPAYVLCAKVGMVHAHVTACILLGQVICLALTVSPVLAEKPRRRKLIALTVISNAVSWLVWAVPKPFITSKSSSSQSIDSVRAMYFVLGGVCLAVHVLSIITCVARQGTFHEMVRSMRPVPTSSDLLPSHVQAVECIVLTGAIAYLVVLEPYGGWDKLIRFLMMSPLVGPPAAFAFHCALREVAAAGL